MPAAAPDVARAGGRPKTKEASPAMPLTAQSNPDSVAAMLSVLRVLWQLSDLGKVIADPFRTCSACAAGVAGIWHG